MKIHVPSIPEAGKVIPLSRSQGWVRELIGNRFQDFCSAQAPLEGEVQLHRVNQNVTLHGDFTLGLQPTCDRCARTFSQELDVELQRYLTPFFAGSGSEEQEEEKELSEEDFEFSCYHGEEIDLGDIIAEEVFLALPMRFLCEPNCKGLCPQCGQNLNEGKCGCEETHEDSPFAALKDVKFPLAPKN